MSSSRHAALPSCRRAVVLVLVLLLAACADLTVPGETMATADLLILPLGSAAPAPASVSFYASNAHATTRNLIHNDGFNTLFARIQFPSGSLSTLDGVSLGANDSVLVTLSADGGVYGIRLEPSGLRFTSAGGPSLTFSYVRYGDLSVASGSRYADPAAYAGALDVWRETSLDQWTGTGGAGTELRDVTTSLSQAGHYLVAAPR